MRKVYVVLNEQHTLLDDQKRVLDDAYGDRWEIYPVPASGWTLDEMKEVVYELIGNDVVFASPVPYLIQELAHANGYYNGAGSLGMVTGPETRTAVLHNDRREKKELSNGKIIMTVAQTGWQLV